jgi:hypothetical protein
MRDSAGKIHSEEHLIAAEVSEYCGEPKAFARYLGVVKRIGKHKSYQIFSELKQREAEYLYKPVTERPPPIKNRGKWFMWKAKTAESD